MLRAIFVREEGISKWKAALETIIERIGECRRRKGDSKIQSINQSEQNKIWWNINLISGRKNAA